MATIEPNFESICINPNDDLVLYKKEIVRSRIEKFLYAICSLDTDDLPTPLSRIEELYNCLVTGEDIPTFTPLSRAEKFVMAMLGVYDVELLPTPISRSETLMKKIATGDNNLDDVDNLQSRYEFLLAYIIKAGGFNGDSGDFYYQLFSLTSDFTTIYNTLDMPVKNAVLRGQTLVNVNRSNFIAESNITTDYANPKPYFDADMKANTTYTIFAYSDNLYEYRLSQIRSGNVEHGLDGVCKVGTPCVFTTYTDFTGLRGYLKGDSLSIPQGTEIKILIIEGDHSNEDIPFFTGMQSVKMPVLKTTGKNLFNKNNIIVDGYIISNGTLVYETGDNRNAADFIEIEPNCIYRISGIKNSAINGGRTHQYVGMYDKNKKFISSTTIYCLSDSETFTTTENTKYIRVSVRNDDINRLQIEKGTTATTYEPHKSNILTCNEEVELRGIGEVKDELNLVTGELIQRIGTYTFTGNETFKSGGPADSPHYFYLGFAANNITMPSSTVNTPLICNRLPTITYDKFTMDGEGINFTYDLRLNFPDCNCNQGATVTDLQNYLKNNETIIYYPIEAVHKTVDLSIVDQDSIETELKTFDDITHVTVSSEGLVPTGDIDIARPIQFVDYSIDNSVTTLYNTIDYPVKNTVLKGQTLVNLVDFETNTVRLAGTIVAKQGNKITFTTSTAGKFNLGCKLPTLKPNTKYLLKIKAESSLSADVSFNILNVTSNAYIISNTTITDTTHFFTTKDIVDDIRLSFHRGTSVGDDTVLGEAVICEYQEGMENWNIPYFEGMASVKMPVVKTVGKNLFDGELQSGRYTMGEGTPFNDSSAVRTVNKITVKPSTKYTISVLGNGQLRNISEYNSGNYIGGIERYFPTYTFETSSTTNEIHISFQSNDLKLQAQLEEGTVATSYEPYKSTTVSCNEEVELCRIGDIKDELNLVTGEYTKAINEYTFTGDENWKINNGANSGNGCSYFSCNLGSGLLVKYNYKTDANIPIYCNRLPVITYSDFDNRLKNVGINLTYFFRLNFSDCDSNNGATVEDLKAYLKANPTTVQYPISKSVKTVDLSTLDQDGKETELSTFDDITHVTVSSEGLIPTGEITVATKNATDVIDASVMSLRMDDILNSQNTLEGSANAQSDDIDVAMLGTTDIYEQLL